MSLQTDLLHPELGFSDEGADLTDPATYTDAQGAFGKTKTLPPLVYRSKPFLELENEKIWTRSWVAIGLSSQIPKPGDLLPFTAGFHGVHVVRMPDGALSGRLNFHQHGGCRFVPEQCRTGKQTKCSIASCNYTRDAHAMPALENGEEAPEMYKFVGINPDKLKPVRSQTLGQVILVNLDPNAENISNTVADNIREILGSPREPHSLAAHEWLDFKCNWKLFGVEFLRGADTVHAHDSDGTGITLFALEATIPVRGDFAYASGGMEDEELRCFWLFPNLLVVVGSEYVLCLVLQATGMGDTLCRVSLLVPPARAGDFKANKDLAAYWISTLRRIGANAAKAHEQMMRLGTSSEPDTISQAPEIEKNFARYVVNQYVIRKVMTKHKLHWEAPIMDARMLQRKGSR